MKYIGIDYGTRKIGIAKAEGYLAEPLGVIRVSSKEESIEKITRMVKNQEPDKVVVGISEEKMAQEQAQFAKNLQRRTNTPVVTWDETLTTQDAQLLARHAQVPRKKRQKLEDAFAATLMLQSYLDAV